MKYRVSLHNHTTMSDGADTMENMILSAIDRGLTHFAITDHCCTYEYEDYSLKPEMYTEYVEMINEYREKYRGKIEIFAGIESERYGEMGYLSSDLSEIRKKLDFVVGSVHTTGINGKVCVVDTEMTDFIRARDMCYEGISRKFVEDYFRNYIDNIRELKPEIAGHLDLVKKNNSAGYFFDEKSSWYRELVSCALDEIKKQDCVMEINTGGAFKHGVRCIYPSAEILEMARDRNIRMTLSSDAHSTEMIGYLYDLVIFRLKKLGIDRLYTYSRQNGEFIPFRID